MSYALSHMEIPQPRLAEIYSRTAAFYDQVVAEHQARAKEVAVEMLAWRPDERLLELGAGTGWLLECLAGRSPPLRVVGLDVAEGMIEVARQRFQESGPQAPQLVLGDAARLPFRDASFDCLVCTYTLEVLPDEAVPRILDELRRVLRPAGRLVIADLTDGEGEDAAFTDDWKRRYAADPEYFGGARPLILPPLLESAGLSVSERRYSGHGAGWPSEVVLARRVD